MTNKTYEDGLPLGVIGLFNFVEITSLQIMVPMGNRTKYEAVMRSKDREIVATREFEKYQDLRSHLAAEMHIGLKYTDAVLDSTIDFNRRFDEANKFNAANPSQLWNQFHTEHVTYSVVHHPAQIHVDHDKSKDRVEQEFYRAVAQLRVPNGDEPDLIFDEVADTMFDAVVLIRTHIEKALMTAFIPGFNATQTVYLKGR